MSRTRRRLEKIAVIGPLVDVSNLGIPSGIGYAMGSGHDFLDEDEAQDYIDDGASVAGTLLMPGYIGYRAGKAKKARRVVRKARRDREKRASAQELELLDMMHQGHFGEQAQAALMGVKEASADLGGYYDTEYAENVSSISDLYVDPEESRNQRLNTLLRRY